jgi:hippurate hydrolase
MFAPWYDAQKLTSHSWLRDLHRHPETGFEKVRTAAFVADRLGAFGYGVETGIGGTGENGNAKVSHGSGEIVLLRAE